MVRLQILVFGFVTRILVPADSICWCIGIGGLGERSVHSLLSHLEVCAKDTVTFDNFFTSNNLMTRLSNDGVFTLGTVRDSRANHDPLLDVKEIKRQPHGTSDFGFDIISFISFNDNAVSYTQTHFILYIGLSFFSGLYR